MEPKTGATMVAKPVMAPTLPRWFSGSLSAWTVPSVLTAWLRPTWAMIHPIAEAGDDRGCRHDRETDEADEHAADDPRAATAEARPGAVAELSG